jgi:poly(3-hydroxybutyrate) depolymerase
MPSQPSFLAVLSALLLVLSYWECGVMADSAGCGKTPTLTSGIKTMQHNGKSRRWILRLPDGYDKSRPYKLMFGLHWRDSDMNGVDGGSAPYYGQKAVSNNSAIFVAPDGLNKGWGNQGGEDVTFIENIVKTIEADLCVNEKLRFTMGFSYGGAMSYSMACSRPELFRAIAVFSGASLSGCSGGTGPVAYYGQHGVRDGVLNIGMGRQLRDTFVRNNKCQAASPQEPARNSRTHIKTQYTGCTPGYPVTFVAFDEDHVALPRDSGGDGGASSWTIKEVADFFGQFT